MIWTTKNMPTQSGKLAVITGASGGLGFKTASALVAEGAADIVAPCPVCDRPQTARHANPYSKATR